MTVPQAEKFLRVLPDVSEKDHWGGDAFVANKRIFATVWDEEKTVNVRLTPADQKKFTKLDKGFKAIDNAWGRQGWTTIHLEIVKEKNFRAGVETALVRSAQALPMGISDKKPSRRKKTRKTPRNPR